MGIKRAITISIGLVFLATVLIASCTREHEGYLDGRADAQRDIAKGVLNVAYADGTQYPACTGEYMELLRKKYGVHQISYSLPLYPKVVEARARGYNEVAQAEIKRRFGSNILTQTMAEAQTLYESKRPASTPKTNLSP